MMTSELKEAAKAAQDLKNKLQAATDVNTGKLETATYTKVFGIVVKTHYEAITEDELTQYLGITR